MEIVINSNWVLYYYTKENNIDFVLEEDIF